MLGYGGSPYGGGPYGGSSDPFVVVSAVSLNYHSVQLTFSNDLASISALISPGSYSINLGLNVLAVTQTSPNTVTVFTSPQTEGTLYTITVVGPILDSAGDSLVVNTAQFTGIGIPLKFLVSNLNATSICSGQAISLSWSNPAGTMHVKIVRRLRAWPFDLTDSFDTVYDGGITEGFVDTGVVTPSNVGLGANANVGDVVLTIPGANSIFSVGDTLRIESASISEIIGQVTFDIVTIQSFGGFGYPTVSPALQNSYATGSTRVSKYSPLLPQTYYYYLVLVSTSATPTTYDIDDASRDFALSIDSSLKSRDWLFNESPQVLKERDVKPLSQNGGDGFLDKWFQVMGCWLNLMRGYFNAISLLNDPNNAPFHALPALNNSLGIDPEGLAYDYDIVRRPLTSLVFVYKRKGTCPGIIETVRMFTKWDATCVDFGTGACQGGATDVKTYDGTSIVMYGQGPSPGQISQSITSADGSGQLIDASGAYSDHLFQNGTLKGFIGDIACVNDNTSGTTITTKPPILVTTTTATASSGSTSISVALTSPFVAGMVVQITKTTSPFLTEIVQIFSVGSGVLNLQGPGLQNTYPVGSIISIGKSTLRTEYTGTTSSTASSQTITDPKAFWVEDQWNGYVLLDSANVTHNVISNTGNQVTVDGVAPTSGEYSIATGFNLGVSFSTRTPIVKYKLSNGVHSTWFEPTYDIKEKGTIYDPYNRLYNGPGLNLSGSFGPSSVGVYILGNIPVISGRAQSASGSVFVLDPSQPQPTVNSLVGYFLNPNQNQEQTFQILANSTTQITVAGDISSLVVPGQFYYVLKPRDNIRFQRVTQRLRTEFSSVDTDIHILFV